MGQARRLARSPDIATGLNLIGWHADDEAVLYLVGILCIGVGVLWLTTAERLVDGFRLKGRLKASNPRPRQITGARAFGGFGIVLGIVILGLAISGVA